MENLLLGIILIIISSIKGRDSLTSVMILGCLVAAIVDLVHLDIVLHYSISALVFALLALASVDIGNTRSRVYAIIMLVQMFMCLSLIPNWGESINPIIEGVVIYFTESITVIIIALAITRSHQC